MATIIGNSLNNILRSNVEADVIDGGAGFDTVDYSLSREGVTIDLNLARQSGGDAQGDQLLSIEKIIGTSFSDKMTGDKSDNTFDGGDAIDFFDGGDGNDTVISKWDQDVDTFFGGTGSDTLDYSVNPNGRFGPMHIVDLEEGTTHTARNLLEAYAQPVLEDKHSGFENVIGTSGFDRITGNGEQNRLEGRDGTDFLQGGKEADVLVGGLGRDSMTGFRFDQPGEGDGAVDTFVFNSAAEVGILSTSDSIANFEFGIDNIDFSAIDANANLGGNQDFHFSAAFGNFDGTAGALVVSGGALSADGAFRSYVVSGDTNGDAVADFSLNVSGSVAINNGLLTAGDFIL